MRVSANDIKRKLSTVILEKPFAKYLGYTHILLWNKVNVDDPLIKNISIARNWFTQTVDAIVQERERYAVWCLQISCFWITEDGQILEKSPTSEGQLINIIHSNKTLDLKPGIYVLQKKEITHLKTILKILRDINISVTKISYDAETLELVIKTEEGTRLLFSLYFNPTLVITSIEELFHKQKLNFKDYIDFRTENKVFYK